MTNSLQPCFSLDELAIELFLSTGLRTDRVLELIAGVVACHATADNVRFFAEPLD